MRRPRNVAEIKQAGFDAAAGAALRPDLSTAGTADWTFATPEETERRLHAAGFSDVWCWLTRVDVDPGDPAGYLGAICLGSFVDRLPEDLREPFVAAALARLPEPLAIHYVRLNILAARREPEAGQSPSGLADGGRWPDTTSRHVR